MLPSIAVPTPVLHARGDAVVPLRQGEQLAEGIPGARLVVLPGADHYLFSGDTAPVVTAVEEFVLGAGLRFVPRGEHVLPGFDRLVPLHEIVA